MAALSDHEIERHARQLVLRDIGPKGQKRLKSAHVAIVGAGGIGNPLALYLGCAGVGALTLYDPDVVSLENLHRQILFTEEDIGAPKAAASAAHLFARNPHCKVHAVETAVKGADAFADKTFDVIINATDRWTSRDAVNRAAVSARLPLITAAAAQWSVQVGLFPAPGHASACFRCLFPEAPDDRDRDPCAEVGVAGPTTGMAGARASALVLSGLAAGGFGGQSAAFETLDVQGARWRRFQVERDRQCPVCA